MTTIQAYEEFKVERINFAPITAPEPYPDEARENLRAMVKGTYMLQDQRIRDGLRLVATFKRKLGIKAGQKETEVDTKTKNLLADLKASYRRVTDGFIKLPSPKKFEADGLISDYAEMCLVAQYFELDALEKENQTRVKHLVEEFPVWQHFLKHVSGVGPLLGGVILSEFIISRAKYPSSLWAYAGLDVAEDGAGRSKRKEHLVEVEYQDSDGNTKTKNSITYNPFLKTKLLLLATSFVRASGRGNSPYGDVYYAYRHRLENHPNHQEKTKLHRHNMALRYAVKMFLIDLYYAWRKLENLPIHVPYEEAKLGRVHTFRNAWEDAATVTTETQQ